MGPTVRYTQIYIHLQMYIQMLTNIHRDSRLTYDTDIHIQTFRDRKTNMYADQHTYVHKATHKTDTH